LIDVSTPTGACDAHVYVGAYETYGDGSKSDIMS